MKTFTLLLTVSSLLALVCAKLDDAQCTEAFHKSAVTPEAAAEAERAKQAKQAYSGGEIYSSKVKSKWTPVVAVVVKRSLAH